MSGYLKYLGTLPRFSLKRDWTQGTSIPLEELFANFKQYCPITDKLDAHFVKWFKEKYVSGLGRDFELVTDLIVNEENKVSIEATVEVASSLEDAQERLRSMRHPDVVGHVERENITMPASRSKVEEIKHLAPAGSAVMTGDDLKQKTQVISNNSQKTNAFTFNEDGEVVKAKPTTKEQKAKLDSQLASVSKGVKVLTEELLTDGSMTSRVLVGGSGGTNEETSNKESAKKEFDDTKVNKYFQGFTTAPTKVEVTVEDIIKAESPVEAAKAITNCKDASVLKIARVYLKDIGNQALVEKIDTRLRLLPPY